MLSKRVSRPGQRQKAHSPRPNIYTPNLELSHNGLKRCEPECEVIWVIGESLEEPVLILLAKDAYDERLNRGRIDPEGSETQNEDTSLLLSFQEQDLLLRVQDDHPRDEFCRNSLEEHIDDQDSRRDRKKTARSVQLLSVRAHTQSAHLTQTLLCAQVTPVSPLLGTHLVADYPEPWPAHAQCCQLLSEPFLLFRRCIDEDDQVRRCIIDLHDA